MTRSLLMLAARLLIAPAAGVRSRALEGRQRRIRGVWLPRSLRLKGRLAGQDGGRPFHWPTYLGQGSPAVRAREASAAGPSGQ
jgi:hypothetical protein